jgi:hypothetical protein
MARITGHEAVLPGYETNRASLAANYNRVLWQGTEYRSPGYTGKTDDRGHGLAALYGLATPDQWPGLKKVFTKSFEASPYMEKYLLEALFRMGDTDAALARLKTRYQKMVESELTTLWEGWGIGSEGYGGGSYNHGWSGGPLTLLGEDVAGIAPTTPGFATYQVKPQLGSLRRVRTGLDTVKGHIAVSIERTETEFHLTLSSPPDTLATVALPLAATVTCNGQVVWPASATTNLPPGLTPLGIDATHLRFTVSPGTWDFLVR